MKSRFSKKLSWPHPLIRHGNINREYSNDYYELLPPSTFQPFESSSESSHKPCPHLFRTSAYVLGSTPELNSALELGCIISPFNSCNRRISQSSIQKTRRCNNCQTFIIAEWMEYKSEKVFCKLCDKVLTSEVENQIRNKGASAVEDIILSKQQNYTRKILFVIEASNNVTNSQFYDHLVHNIQLLRQQQLGYNVQFGFLLYDEAVTIISKGKQSVQLIKVMDYEEGEFPLPMRSVFFDAESDLWEVFEIMEDLIQSNENSRRPKFNYYQVLNLISSQIQPFSEVILIASNFKIPIISKEPKAETKQISKILQLADHYLLKSVVINLFAISKDKRPLENINRLVEKTGGICNVHLLNKQYSPQDFYYDLYEYFHTNHYYDISIKVNTSKDFICTQLDNKVFEQKGERSLRLSKLSQHSNFNVFLKVKSKINKALINIEVKYRYRGMLRIRIINHSYLVSDKLSDVYSSLGDQCLFYLTLRKQILSKDLTKLSNIPQSLVNAYKKIMMECRNIWQLSASFSIPNCLKYSIFYSQSVFRHIQTISDKQSLYLFNEPLYNWKHSSLERLSKMISMKLYRIDKKQEIANIKYYYYNIEQDGIYAIENGKYIYFYIGQNVSPAIIQDCLVHDSHQISMVGETLNNFIQNLREHNPSNYLQLKVINQFHKQILLDGLFIEDAFKRFLKNLCQ